MPAAPDLRPGHAGSAYDMGALLRHMVELQASDLFLTARALPVYKVNGRMMPSGIVSLASGEVRQLAWSVMTDAQKSQFQQRMACDMAWTVEGLGRFRFNVYVQRGEVSMVVRYVKAHIPTLAALRLPPVLERLAMLRQGLVLVVGSTGAGKSTTLAAMLEHRNQRAPGHILTIEDPIEYLHEHGHSIVNQREVGLDTPSFASALHDALRESPDVIMIGEIRDRETMRHALHFAETGHLCISTLHANSANQAIERVVNLFPQEGREQLLMDLSQQLKGVVGQRLIESSEGHRVPATEIMLLTAYVAELIKVGEIDKLKAVIGRSNEVGMHSFDQSLFELYEGGVISGQQALQNADSLTDLSLRMRLTTVGAELAALNGADTLEPTPLLRTVI